MERCSLSNYNDALFTRYPATASHLNSLRLCNQIHCFKAPMCTYYLCLAVEIQLHLKLALMSPVKLFKTKVHF